MGRGEYLSQFGGEGNRDHQLHFPWGLSVDNDGNIIVADSKNNLIKIFSPSGQLLRKFGGEGLFNSTLSLYTEGKQANSIRRG